MKRGAGQPKPTDWIWQIGHGSAPPARHLTGYPRCHPYIRGQKMDDEGPVISGQPRLIGQGQARQLWAHRRLRGRSRGEWGQARTPYREVEGSETDAQMTQNGCNLGIRKLACSLGIQSACEAVRMWEYSAGPTPNESVILFPKWGTRPIWRQAHHRREWVPVGTGFA